METTKATKQENVRRKTKWGRWARENKWTAAKATELPTDKVLLDPTISVQPKRRHPVVRLRAKQFHQGRLVRVWVYTCPHLVHAISEMAQIRDKIETEKLCKDDVLKLITPRRWAQGSGLWGLQAEGFRFKS